MEKQSTIGRYLAQRLEQLGVKHVFGVPGDYVMEFMDNVLERINLVCTCNELNGGYAADGYARICGLGCLVVTYNVGSFSALNAVAGAYAEDVPLIVISGAPTVGQSRTSLPMHHLVEQFDHQRRVFESVTVASIIIDDALTAPALIDEALTACIRESKPIFIELPMDMVSVPCAPPQNSFRIAPKSSNAEALAECVAEANRLLAAARSPAILAGALVDRQQLRRALFQLVDKAGCQTAVTIDAVGTISPGHSSYRGIYQGRLGTGDAKSVVETADCLIMLGVRRTDITSAGFSGRIDRRHLIKADSYQVQIGHHIYDEVYLRDFLPALTESLSQAPSPQRKEEPVPEPASSYNRSTRITSDRFFACLNHFIGKESIVVSDSGDAFFQTSQMSNLDAYVNQSFYLSIGYSLPAALGAALAQSQKRTILVIGDGAFQMTAQELSTIVRMKLPLIIFLINNDGYVIERMLHHEAAYNDINRWRYAELPRVFGECTSLRVETEGDLDSAFQLANETSSGPVFVEIVLERNDCSSALRNIKDLISTPH